MCYHYVWIQYFFNDGRFLLFVIYLIENFLDICVHHVLLELHVED